MSLAVFTSCGPRDGAGIEQRAEMMKVWGGFMFFIMGALGTLPDYKGVVYRGYPDKKEVVEQYKLGRPIQWPVLLPIRYLRVHTRCNLNIVS